MPHCARSVLKSSTAFAALLLIAVSVVSSPILGQETPAPSTAASPPSTEDKVLLVIGEKEYRQSDILNAAKDMPEQYRENLDRVLPFLIRRFAHMTLLAEAGYAEKLQDSAEVKARMAEFEKDAVRAAYIENHLEKTITEDKIRARYEEIAKDIAAEEEIQARHILVETEAEARDLLKQLEAGGDFAALAKAKSKDKGSGAQGGDLGWFPPQVMVEEFAKAVQTIPVGTLGKDPIKTQFGWHIIKVEGRRNKQPPAYDDMKDRIKDELADKAIEAMLKDMVVKTDVKAFNPDGSVLDLTQDPPIGEAPQP